MATIESLIDANCALRSAARAKPESSLVRRSSKGLSVTNTIPEFGLAVKPLMLKPGKATLDWTPGWSSAICDMRRITASVRSRDAPSGSCAKATRYCLSCVGTKPVGTCRKPQPARNTSPTYTTSASADLRITPATLRP